MNGITQAKVNVAVHGALMAAFQGLRTSEDDLSPTVQRAVGPLIRYVRETARIVQDFEATAMAIDSDPDATLSPLNRAERMLAEAKAAIAEIGLENELPDLIELVERQAESFRAAFTLPDEPDQPSASQVASEIRGHVKSMDGLSQMDFLTKQAGHEPTVRAILSAPPYLSGLAEHRWEFFRKAAMAEVDPDRAAALELIDRLKDAAEKGARNGVDLIAQRAGIHRRNGEWHHRFATGAQRLA